MKAPAGNVIVIVPSLVLTVPPEGPMLVLAFEVIGVGVGVGTGVGVGVGIGVGVGVVSAVTCKLRVNDSPATKVDISSACTPLT